MSDPRPGGVGRRAFLTAGLALPAVAAAGQGAQAQAAPPPGRRRLGKLEVSSVGLGVQNMSRT